ncbi:MAG: hypothetical protein ABI688_03775 [Bacteroidota bacterium]
MKKNFLSMVILAIVVSMASCKSSSSFEKDVKKRAEYMCKVQQLSVKAAADESAAKDLEKVRKEMEDFDASMETRYKGKDPTADESAKAAKIMKDVMDNCK